MEGGVMFDRTGNHWTEVGVRVPVITLIAEMFVDKFGVELSMKTDMV